MCVRTYILVFLVFVANNNFAQNSIPIPDTLSGSNIELILKNSTKTFFSTVATKTIGYNGNYLGPTLILNKGQEVNLSVTNSLNEQTTTHLHGLHVAPHNDGSPHNPIAVGERMTRTFPIMDKAGTYWYHPHLHKSTMKQVVKGAAGLIIVRDEEESKLNLPRKYGVDDIPLVLQFQSFDNNQQILENDELDNQIIANGTIKGQLNCPAQIVRLRLLNGSSHRVFRLGFTNNITFYQITSDDGLLNKPVQFNRLNLGSGERAEILLDLSKMDGKTVELLTFGNELPTGYPGGPAMMNMSLGPLDNKTTQILTINVTKSTENPVTTIPTTLTYNEIWQQESGTRNIILSGTPMMNPTNFYINNRQFDEKVIDFTTNKDRTEVWNITNQSMMAHPFHIHGNYFYILSINGATPPENMRGRKDVVLVPPMNGNVKLITKYEDFTDDEMPYMYHCHILSHEDNGMMGQFLVSSKTASSEIEKTNNFIVYPNPVKDLLHIKNMKDSARIENATLYNILGIKVLEQTNIIDTISFTGIAPGEYFLKLYFNNKFEINKVIKL